MPTEPDDDLELMPRSVRDKLDRVGLKIHLREWQQLALEERRRLYDRPCDSEEEAARYRVDLTEMIRRRCGSEPDEI